MWTIEQLKGRQVYLDANVFIYAFETPTSILLPNRALGDIFRLISQDLLWARTSALTRAEVLVHPLRHGLAALEADYRLLLNGQQGIVVDAITDAVLEQAVALRATLGLKLADAIHVASAISTGCDCLISADRGLLRCSAHIEILPLADLTDTRP